MLFKFTFMSVLGSEALRRAWWVASVAAHDILFSFPNRLAHSLAPWLWLGGITPNVVQGLWARVSLSTYCCCQDSPKEAAR